MSLVSFRLDGLPYQVVFIREQVTRLADRGEPDFDIVELVDCQILDSKLNIVAEGRAIKAANDPYDQKIGGLLSLARALDDAESAGLWRRRVSRVMLSQARRALHIVADIHLIAPEYVALMQADTNLDAAKIMLAADARVAARARDGARDVRPALSMNDAFRAQAERLGLSLDTTVGALSMADLSRFYRAMTKVRPQ